jgi:hypothetical protein
LSSFRFFPLPLDFDSSSSSLFFLCSSNCSRCFWTKPSTSFHASKYLCVTLNQHTHIQNTLSHTHQKPSYTHTHKNTHMHTHVSINHTHAKRECAHRLVKCVCVCVCVYIYIYIYIYILVLKWVYIFYTPVWLHWCVPHQTCQGELHSDFDWTHRGDT